MTVQQISSLFSGHFEIFSLDVFYISTNERVSVATQWLEMTEMFSMTIAYIASELTNLSGIFAQGWSTWKTCIRNNSAENKFAKYNCFDIWPSGDTKQLFERES